MTLETGMFGVCSQHLKWRLWHPSQVPLIGQCTHPKLHFTWQHWPLLQTIALLWTIALLRTIALGHWDLPGPQTPGRFCPSPGWPSAKDWLILGPKSGLLATGSNKSVMPFIFQSSWWNQAGDACQEGTSSSPLLALTPPYSYFLESS